MFDNGKEQTIEGEVKDFQWTNPHIWIQVNVKGNDGKTTEYSIEGGSPNGLKRQGWTKKSINAGDKIVLKMHPLKDGTPGGNLHSYWDNLPNRLSADQLAALPALSAQVPATPGQPADWAVAWAKIGRAHV